MQEFFITLKLKYKHMLLNIILYVLYWTILHYSLVFRKNFFFFFCDSQLTYMGMLIYLAYLKEFMSKEFVNSQKSVTKVEILNLSPHIGTSKMPKEVETLRILFLTFTVLAGKIPYRNLKGQPSHPCQEIHSIINSS